MLYSALPLRIFWLCLCSYPRVLGWVGDGAKGGGWWRNAHGWCFHHERAQIPYPDITGMYLAPDIKISGHIHGRPKCQISLKLPCFLTTTSNFLRCWMLVRPPMVYYVEYNALQRAAGLWDLICSHTVSSSMVRWPACVGSYGCIRSLSMALRLAWEGLYGCIWSLLLWHHSRPVRPHIGV